jgi:hypothetical protein
MARIKGSEKTGGRTKGTLNKITEELRIPLKDLLVKYQGRFEDALQELDARDFVSAYIQIFKHVTPPAIAKEDENIAAKSKRLYEAIIEASKRN